MNVVNNALPCLKREVARIKIDKLLGLFEMLQYENLLTICLGIRSADNF